MQIRKNLSIFSFVVLCAGCSNLNILRETLVINKTSLAKPNPSVSSPYHVITVFVHGTKLFTDKILKNFFHSPDGLILASKFDKQYHLRSLADALSGADPKHYPSGTMYLFGWNGDLSFKERMGAAVLLHRELCDVINQYEQKYKVKPKIRIITHSHGGNVVLNMANLKNEQNLVIDELILLACPVQKETVDFILSPMFKEVFVLYSSTDLLQVIDPQGLYNWSNDRPIFSEREFPAEHIMQVKIRLNGRSLLHIDFYMEYFFELLPAIMEKIRSWHEDIKKQSNKMYSAKVLSVNTRK